MMHRMKHPNGYACAAFGFGLTIAAFMPSHAAAQALPSLDCSKSQTAVEKLICGNAGLAALDRETTRLYDLAKAGGGGELLASQRAWLDGRNDCASSTDKQRCVAESFVQRISELRESYPAERKADSASISIGPFNATCENFGEPVPVPFVNSVPAFA